jgi:hypothetical protein
MSSVNDAPFVSDVLLYDRLVIPVADRADPSADEFWAKFDPEAQRRCLDILKAKTDDKDGLALTIPWGAAKRERFKNRMSTTAALASQRRHPDQQYYLDPFEMTKQLIKDEFLPALPKGVSKAWPVAAYTSADAYREDIAADRRRRLAAFISHRFLTPAGKDPDHELLKRAVGLATTDDFRRKRADFYKWQEGIIENEITDEKAIEEMEKLLREFNEATTKAFNTVVVRYAFTVIPIALTITGAVLAGAPVALGLAGAGGLVQMARFWKFDRKPVIEAGDLDSAAMIHDARDQLPLE